ncbi:hypothetical protein DFH06DRAFT_1147833 [Mycena polygramma]|nr:hypothetical protein DFH06DRAFT_1147833 [Mycena polygramma]
MCFWSRGHNCMGKKCTRLDEPKLVASPSSSLLTFLATLLDPSDHRLTYVRSDCAGHRNYGGHRSSQISVINAANRYLQPPVSTLNARFATAMSGILFTMDLQVEFDIWRPPALLSSIWIGEGSPPYWNIEFHPRLFAIRLVDRCYVTGGGPEWRHGGLGGLWRLGGLRKWWRGGGIKGNQRLTGIAPQLFLCVNGATNILANYLTRQDSGRTSSLTEGNCPMVAAMALAAAEGTGR